MIESRLASSADIDTYYGSRPRESLRVYAVLMDGVPMGVIGLALMNTHARFFSEFKPQLREHLRCMTILRTIKKAMQFVVNSRVPVVAISTPEEPHSIEIIKRLGFKHYRTAPDGEVFKWQP